MPAQQQPPNTPNKQWNRTNRTADQLATSIRPSCASPAGQTNSNKHIDISSTLRHIQPAAIQHIPARPPSRFSLQPFDICYSLFQPRCVSAANRSSANSSPNTPIRTTRLPSPRRPRLHEFLRPHRQAATDAARAAPRTVGVLSSAAVCAEALPASPELGVAGPGAAGSAVGPATASIRRAAAAPACPAKAGRKRRTSVAKANICAASVSTEAASFAAASTAHAPAASPVASAAAAAAAALTASARLGSAALPVDPLAVATLATALASGELATGERAARTDEVCPASASPALGSGAARSTAFESVAACFTATAAATAAGAAELNLSTRAWLPGNMLQEPFADSAAPGADQRVDGSAVLDCNADCSPRARNRLQTIIGLQSLFASDSSVSSQAAFQFSGTPPGTTAGVAAAAADATGKGATGRPSERAVGATAEACLAGAAASLAANRSVAGVAGLAEAKATARVVAAAADAVPAHAALAIACLAEAEAVDHTIGLVANAPVAAEVSHAARAISDARDEEDASGRAADSSKAPGPQANSRPCRGQLPAGWAFDSSDEPVKPEPVERPGRAAGDGAANCIVGRQRPTLLTCLRPVRRRAGAPAAIS